MTESEVSSAVHDILTQHFNIPPNTFSWDTPLEALQKDFKILSYLIFLEQLIQQQFGDKVTLLEGISTAYHTPQDVVELIMREMD